VIAALEDGYGSGSIRCWWLRWLSNGKPGYWTLTVVGPIESRNYNAVADDFGNLVVVA
jgi:hypothetical protein